MARNPKSYSITAGSIETGQDTELAMKHISCASRCNEIAFALSDPVATLAVGCRTILAKRPLPSASSIMVPIGSSRYANTTTPALAQR